MSSKLVRRKADRFSTLTHARVRAAQGDRSGARQVLRAVLQREPWNRAARDLFEQLAGPDRPAREDRSEASAGAPVGATAAELGERFRQVLDNGGDPRIHRLATWLGRISDQQGGDDAQ